MRGMRRLWRTLVGAAALGACLGAAPQGALAAGETAGPVTGLPVPRYVSLKTDRVNLREGPSKEHRTSWVFQRAGLPVEITAEFETWRRIRDSEGAEGWVLHSLLSAGARRSSCPGRATARRRCRCWRAPTSAPPCWRA